MTEREIKNKRNREYRAKHRDRLRDARAANLDARYNDLKNRAKRDGRKFKISRRTYKRMVEGGCYYCEASLMDELGGSLDRVNNSNRNYVTKNVVPCCKSCNYVKSNVLSKDEMIYTMEMLRALREGDADAVEVQRLVKNRKEEKRRNQVRGKRKSR